MSPNIYILSPHVDDAAYGLTLHISGLIRNHRPLYLINCFTVTRWTAVPVASREIEDVMRLRASEDEEYNNLFQSAIRITNLNLLDAPLRNGYIYQHKPFEPNERELIGELIEYIKKTVDGILFCPLAIGNHIDHALCRQAVEELYAQLKVVFYEDLPYAARISYPEIVAHVSAFSKKLDVVLESQVYDLRHCQINKELAIRLYKSQMNEQICSEIITHMQAVAGERVWGQTATLQMLKELLAC